MITCNILTIFWNHQMLQASIVKKSSLCILALTIQFSPKTNFLRSVIYTSNDKQGFFYEPYFNLRINHQENPKKN